MIARGISRCLWEHFRVLRVEVGIKPEASNVESLIRKGSVFRSFLLIEHRRNLIIEILGSFRRALRISRDCECKK